MTNQTDKEYFADTTAISNSQLRTFVSYNKYGQRLLTPDDYIAEHVDKAVKFIANDAVIIWKIVDKFFDGAGKDVWNYYIPVARRTWKEIKAVKDSITEDETIKYVFEETAKDGKVIYLSKFEVPRGEDVLVGQGATADESVANLIEQYVDENYMEITMGMKDDADAMIARGVSFRTFKKFLQTEGTEAQVQLKADVEITDPATGEVRSITMKGKPDFVNRPNKLIVDLKTTGSREMIIEWLQFKGEPKLTAAYIRQLSIYNKMMGGDNDGALALVTSTGVKWIFIPNQYLVDAWEILEKDILDLDTFLKDPDSLDESIFTYDESLDNLSL